jgi:RNA polymerase-binding transcription factor DksA
MAFPDFTSLEALLSIERVRTIERIAALTRDRQGLIDSAAGVGVDDEHDPEGATIAFERSQLEAFLDLSHRHLTDLDRALRQLRVGDYGICETCGEPIASERLAARPTARTCITCASRQQAPPWRASS